MSGLGWLWISDLHVGDTLGPSLWPLAEDEFRRDIERVHRLAGPFDFVLCTGDLVQTGAASEFSALTEKLEGLFDHLASLGSSPVLVVVPGNHDLSRPDERAHAVRHLLQWPFDPELRGTTFWHETSGKPFRDILHIAFAEFSAWLAAWEAAHPLPSGWFKGAPGILPGDFALTLRKNGITLGLLGLNSAFAQLTPNVKRGHVAVHPLQVQHVCGDLRHWTSDHDVDFLATHHSPVWFTPDATVRYQTEIFRPEWLAAHFCGHLHESATVVPSQPGTAPSRVFQAPSLLGLSHHTDVHNQLLPRPHGYSAIRLSLNDERKATLRFFPRVLQAQKGATQKHRFIPNHTDFDLDDDNAFTVDLGARPPPPPMSLRRPSLPPAAKTPIPSTVSRPAVLPGPPAAASSPSSLGAALSLRSASAEHEDDEAPEPPGLGYNARWYVPSEPKEQLILGTLGHPGAPVVVTAPPFSGKSTVLQRVVSRLRDDHHAGRERCLVLHIDLGSVGDTVLADPPAFFLELGEMLVDAFERAARESGAPLPGDTETWVSRAWQRPGAPETRLTSLLERRILPGERDRLVLALDRAERFVGKPCGDPMARMLRQWVRAGALGEPLWEQFRLVLAAAGSSLYFYAPDAVSELFASATHVRIERFSLADVRRMAALYRGEWSDSELARLADIVDGQPYLSRMILFLERCGVPKAELLDIDRLKIEHCATVLRQVWLRIADQPDLRKPLCLLLRDAATKLSTDEYHRLYQSGLVRRDGNAYVLPNKLVASYFAEQC